MNFNQEWFEMIEDYINGNLKGESLKTFKKELKSNPSLRKEVKLHQDMNCLLRKDDEESSFRAKLKKLSNRFKNGQTDETNNCEGC